MKGTTRPVCHIGRYSAGTVVEWRLGVIDIYSWISTESGSIVTRLLFSFSLLNTGSLPRESLRSLSEQIIIFHSVVYIYICIYAATLAE